MYEVHFARRRSGKLTVPESLAQKTDDSRREPDQKILIKWRQEKVLTLRAKAFTVDEIVSKMRGGNPDVRISHGTVISDLKAIRHEINGRLYRYTNDLVFELHLTLQGLQETIKEAWKLADKEPEKKVKALHLIQDCYLKKYELMSNNKTFVEYASIFKNGQERLKRMCKMIGESKGDRRIR